MHLVGDDYPRQAVWSLGRLPVEARHRGGGGALCGLSKRISSVDGISDSDKSQQKSILAFFNSKKIFFGQMVAKHWTRC